MNGENKTSIRNQQPVNLIEIQKDTWTKLKKKSQQQLGKHQQKLNVVIPRHHQHVEHIKSTQHKTDNIYAKKN